MKHWHRCLEWTKRGLPCPFGEEEAGKEQEPQEDRPEEAVRQSRAEATARSRARAHVPADVRQPANVLTTVQVGRLIEAIGQPVAAPVDAIIDQMPLPPDLVPIQRRATRGSGQEEDIREHLTPRIVRGAESGARQEELSQIIQAGPGPMPPPTAGSRVPVFQPQHARAAEVAVAELFQRVIQAQIQSEEVGAAASSAAATAAVQVQSEEVTSSRSIQTQAEFTNTFATSAGRAIIAGSLKAGQLQSMRGMERANLLATQTQVGGSEPVRASTSAPGGRSGALGLQGARTGSGGGSSGEIKGLGPNAVRPLLFLGSLDRAMRQSAP